MTANNETAMAILAACFEDLMLVWVPIEWIWSKSGCPIYPFTIYLVVSHGTPADHQDTYDIMYGHFCTKTQMKHMPGCYWKKAPVPVLLQDVIDLHRLEWTYATSCLDLLCIGSVGGILVVVIL
jgi:hypothetical protein